MFALAELFPAGDYRFHLTLKRAAPAEFFAGQDASGNLLRERQRWLAESPVRYAALRPGGQEVLAEFADAASSWGVRPPAARGDIVAWGACIEPDILLLRADEAGEFRLQGGALCFPTGWALEEKLGRTMDEIHGVVPGLNPALGAPIRQFLQRLKPGMAWLRANWGIAASDELNLHPVRAVPPPALPIDLTRLWLRVEEQALLALPITQGVLFGIRIARYRLDLVAAQGEVAAGLRHALLTMPAALADYKRIAEVRGPLAARL